MDLKYCNITIYYNSESQLKLLPTHFHLDNIPMQKMLAWYSFVYDWFNVDFQVVSTKICFYGIRKFLRITMDLFKPLQFQF